MDHTIAEEYKSSLNDLNFNSKPLINMLTMLADENKKHAALIVTTIVNHINSTSPESKLPGLYLVDSIIKNLGDQYLKIFCQHIIPLFTSVFEKVDENTRSLMFKLRQTWTDILPNKVLYNLDVSVKKMDPAWPITAKNPTTKKILINPKFLESSAEEKKPTPEVLASDIPTAGVSTSSVLKKEEDKIKQRQGEVLKQLLAKQEQLRQLEFKKRQLTMKKSGTSSHMASAPTNTYKVPMRDPRMVKINNGPQNNAVTNVGTNSASQGKLTLGLDVVSHASGFHGGGKAAIHSKSQVSYSHNSKSSSVIENSSNLNNPKDFVQPAVSNQKPVLKNKSDKWTANKNKCSIVSKDKVNQESKDSSVVLSSLVEVDESCIRNEGSSDKMTEKNLKSPSKVGKTSPKKKAVASENNSKMSGTSIVATPGFSKKKLPLLRIPKKSDKLKSINSNILSSKSSGNISASNESGKRKKTPPDQSACETKPVDKSRVFQSESVRIVDKSAESDIQTISQKDEDLRIHPVPLNDEAVSVKRMPKREIADSDICVSETDKTHLPKKSRTEDIKNLNPDFRSGFPPLFGSEDQDLRQLDVNSKDWSHYKATHPEECSPIIKPESSEGKFRFRRHQFPNFKHHYPSEQQDRYSRYNRGRFSSRYSRRPRFARAWGRPLHIFPEVAPEVMRDSQHFLRQAEERYRLGKISEADYRDIRHGLQKMVQSYEYKNLKNLSKPQEHGHQNQNLDAPEGRKEYDHENNFSVENLKIQSPSTVLQSVKPFVLDGTEKFIHFVDDRALILMDNNEPRELTFKDEQRKVFIDGVHEPLILQFDGKSAEFEVDGRRHIIRLGVPGRELYINNHPYEAQFGGPPIAAMLEDGCVYKLRINGPPPQVVIGNKPQYELFSRYGNKPPAFPPEANYKNEEEKLETQYCTPSSGAFLQDVDMRQKPDSMNPPEALPNKDFYVQDMKDVDWRHIPPSNELESGKNHPKVFPEVVSETFERWPDKDNENQNAFRDERNNQDMKDVDRRHIPSSNELESGKNHPKVFPGVVSETFERWPDKDNENQNAFRDERNNQQPLQEQDFKWESSMQHRQPEVQRENTDLTASTSKDNWYYNQDMCSWRDEYNFALPPEKRPRYQGPNQHFAVDQVESYSSRNNQFQQHMPYARRPSYPNRRMRSRGGPIYGPWVSNVDRVSRPSDSLQNQPPTNFPAGPSKSKALLPSPPFPPDYPPSSHPSQMPPHVDPCITRFGIFDESSNDFSSQLGQSSLDTKPADNADMNVDVESLLEKLVAAGIINTKPYEQPLATTEPEAEPEPATTSETSEADTKKDSEAPSEEIPDIEFTPESLRVHHPGVISALHKGLQCATCGMRFKEMQSDHYSRHLDWHFRMNRREKDGAKKAISRRWHYEVEDWIQFEEFEDFEERVPSYFELQADTQQIVVPEVPTVISVPATSDDEEACPVCSERFQLFWVEDEEEWHYRDAVRHDKVTYHPACYEDFKKAAETEKKVSVKMEISETDEVEDDANDLMQSILDEVEVISKIKIEPPEEDLDTSETVEKVPSETQSEEEILEGKPGEEEIIGVISESDMEVENDIPKTESKMVVMQSGGITLKVKAESLQCHSPSNPSEKDTKQDEDKTVDSDEIDFRPPTPDPNFKVMPPVSKGRELSGLCCIM